MDPERRKRRKKIRRDRDGQLPCPKCLGTQFSKPQKVAWPNSSRKEPCLHVKCLNCGTVSYSPLTDGWETNMYCGNPKEHFKEAA